MKYFTYFIGVLGLFALVSCSVKPKPIEFGQDDCDYCKMTISDERFGAELVSKKGRIYKFDDLHCILEFMDDQIVETNNVASVWGVDFASPGELINLEESWILKNEALKSPMGSNAASFKTKEEATSYQEKYQGDLVEWKEFSK